MIMIFVTLFDPPPCVEVIRIDRGCPDRTFKAAKWDPVMGGDDDDDDNDDDDDDDNGDDDDDDNDHEDCWYARREGE